VQLRSRSTALLLLLAACVVQTQRGPDLGRCADPPPGVYTYGQIGIGTCIAGPSDLAFLEHEGRTWLAVSNADPYYNFEGGSLLLLDWDAVDPSVPRINVADLNPGALALDRFMGGIGIVTTREPQLAIVTNRLSPGAATRSAEDKAYVIDLSDPSAPELWTTPELPLKDDPYPVAVSDTQERVYIGNLTDHSISVVRTRDQAPDGSGDLFGLIDVAPQARIDEAWFDDRDGSGTAAQLDRLVSEIPDNLVDDVWTLTYVDGVSRLIIPDDVGGAQRWSGGDLGFVQAAAGVAVDRDGTITRGEDIADPFVALASDVPVLFYLTPEGSILRASSDGTAGGYVSEGAVLTNTDFGWDATLGGPSVSTVDGRQALFYDGAVSRDAGSAVSIGLATSDDGLSWRREAAPVLAAFDPADPDSLPWERIQQPYVRVEAPAGVHRMWMSLWDGDRWQVGLSESEDGLAWSAPEVVLSDPLADVAAPAITYMNGRYIAYVAMGDDTQWSVATAWSYDGRSWTDLDVLVPHDGTYDLYAPPRAGLQADGTSAWRLQTRDRGVLELLITSGSGVELVDFGLSMQVASGYSISEDLDGVRAAGGMRPGAAAVVNGRDVLYITAVDSSGRERIAVLRRSGTEWRVVEGDAIPNGVGGNRRGASDPVVVPVNDGWVMLYAATDREGVVRMRRAESSDGLTGWKPLDGAVVDSGEDWDAFEQRPHSVEALDDGRVRVWYAGGNGSRTRIGAVIGDSVRGRLRPDPGEFDPYQLGTGVPGSFDDSSVRDPLVLRDGDVTHLYYSGFDGISWHIGHATRDARGRWVRLLDDADRTAPVMSRVDRTFSHLGVHSPVALPQDGGLAGAGGWDFFYGGSDGVKDRIGEAVSSVGGGEDSLAEAVLYPAQRFATADDTFVFGTARGDPEVSVIELAQSVEDFTTIGVGMANIALDERRGFLYAASKLLNRVWVADIRDDSSGLVRDSNFLDLEAVLQIDNLSTDHGFRDIAIAEQRGLLYLSGRSPDAIVAVDLEALVDDDLKDLVTSAAVGTLPAPDINGDRGVTTSAAIGSSGMVLSPDERYLWATHYRDNSITVYDLSLGAYGEAIQNIPFVGENPHVLRTSPDGRFVVAANYTGEVNEEGTASGTLSVIDADPASPTFLEVLTRIVNR
jgi:DNA-binding beta-propeller fold protein YncE